MISRICKNMVRKEILLHLEAFAMAEMVKIHVEEQKSFRMDCVRC